MKMVGLRSLRMTRIICEVVKFCLMVGTKFCVGQEAKTTTKFQRVVRDDNPEWKWWLDGMDDIIYIK